MRCRSESRRRLECRPSQWERETDGDFTLDVLKTCHPERSRFSAKRRICGVEGPREGLRHEKAENRFGQNGRGASLQEFPVTLLAAPASPGSFDCGDARFANASSAQDDSFSSKA